MKYVFNNQSTIAHMWANQTQDNARNSGNFFYDNDTIYSYGRHFPIARHVTNEAGQKAVLFTTRSYSNTTAKHISIVRQASRHLNVLACHTPSEHNHHTNFADWLNRIEYAASFLPRAKKPEKYLSLIDEVRREINAYIGFWGISIPEDLSTALSISNKEEYVSYQTKKSELELLAKEHAAAELAKKHKKDLAEWLKGKGTRLYVHNGKDYLRIKEDRIETSQAVRIPIQIGESIYRKIISNQLQPGDKILDYTVDSVGDSIKVGCHTFEKSYLLKFGQKHFKTA